MSNTDWFGPNKFWKLTIKNVDLKSLMASEEGDDKNRFTLEPSRCNSCGDILYFTVEFTGTALPAVWKDVRLFPRGNSIAPVPPGAPFAESNQAVLHGAAKVVLSHLVNHAASTERLDGQIDLNGKPAGLTFIQIPNAVSVAGVPNEAMLCMFITTDAVGPYAASPDGTGGGSSGHT